MPALSTIAIPVGAFWNAARNFSSAARSFASELRRPLMSRATTSAPSRPPKEIGRPAASMCTAWPSRRTSVSSTYSSGSSPPTMPASRCSASARMDSCHEVERRPGLQVGEPAGAEHLQAAPVGEGVVAVDDHEDGVRGELDERAEVLVGGADDKATGAGSPPAPSPSRLCLPIPPLIGTGSGPLR